MVLSLTVFYEILDQTKPLVEMLILLLINGDTNLDRSSILLSDALINNLNTSCKSFVLYSV